MNTIIRCFMLIALLSAAAVTLAQDDHPHWTYEGEAGPEHWGELNHEYAACSVGRSQSPINIAEPIEVDLVNIAFNYEASALNIFNNGHTIQVNYDSGSTITYNEDTYELRQFHFHHPSEHTINGEPAAMEIHFVHSDAAGNLAVVGVMVAAGEADNSAYAPIFDNLPAEEGEPQATDITVHAADLLPETTTYATYRGSLTTPPCTEGVRWLLLTAPIELSEAQIASFAALFENNARPVQPLNIRDLLADSSP